MKTEEVPLWAVNFIAEVKDFLHIHHSVKVVWTTRKSGVYSRGRFWYNGRGGGRMCIWAGTDIVDLKMIICHELCHCKIQGHHSRRFWDWAWRTYRWAGLPLDYCLKREGDYKKRSVSGYHRIIGG